MRKLCRIEKQIPIEQVVIDAFAARDVSASQLRDEALRHPGKLVTVVEYVEKKLTPRELDQQKALQDGLALAKELKHRSLTPAEIDRAYRNEKLSRNAIDKLYARELTADDLCKRTVTR